MFRRGLNIIQPFSSTYVHGCFCKISLKFMTAKIAPT
uniref:Uncharacterized protein n=2 Tax=Anguilla anguilla TaxID=7936 RepID=A0A0E9RQU7_ANGAN